MVENNKSERFKIDKIDKVEEILINKTKYFRYVCESDRKVNSNENYLILFNGKEIKELIIYTGNHPKFTYKYEDPEYLGLDNLGDFRIEQSLSDENTYLIRVEKKVS